MEGAKLDRWGYQVGTSDDSCIFAINSCYHQVLSYGREKRVILEAPEHDKECVLGNILAAYFLSSSDSSKASSRVQAAKSRLDEATSYEKAVFDAVSHLISDDKDADLAVELHSKLLKKFPRDLLSLKRAQVLCFYMGRPDLSLDLVQQVLPYNQLEDYIYGMFAFALLELGRMADAEVAAKKGFEINKQDFWLQHALCHVLQYECRFKEAVQLMEECSSTWSHCSSFMYTHNWWHIALCCLEGHSPMRKVLEVYDNHIWNELEKSDSASPDVYVRDELDVFGDRLKILAGCITDQANWNLEWHLDLLILWALAFTGELSKAEDLLNSLKSRHSVMNKKQQQLMQIGIQKLYMNMGEATIKKALELLDPDFDANFCKMLGASNEQLDVFNEVWYNMLLNTGQAAKAIEVLEKRVRKREGVPFMWRLLERANSMAGREEDAAIVGKKARASEAAYFKWPVPS